MNVAEDARTDELSAAYLRARSKRQRTLALADLVQAADGFIRRVVRYYSQGQIRDLDREEALQTGRLAYVDAIRRWKPDKGDLRPYAMGRIRFELQRITERNYTIRIPRRAAGDRPRVVTSIDAPLGEDGKLLDVMPVDDPDALAVILGEERRIERSRIVARLDELTAPPEGKIIVESTTTREVTTNGVNGLAHHAPVSAVIANAAPVQATPNALVTLNMAMAGMRDYLAGLDRMAEDVARQRSEAHAALAAAVGVVAPPPAPAARTKPAPAPPAEPRGHARKARKARKAVGDRKGAGVGLEARVKLACASAWKKLAAIRLETGAQPGPLRTAISNLRDRGELKSRGKTKGIEYRAS